MPLKRTPHWATRELNAFLLANAKAAFAWGTMDCCLFPADGIHAMTGTDIAADFRGKYTDEASAMALIKSVTGGATVADAAAYCATKAGMKEWLNAAGKPAPLFAQRGDLVVIQNGANLVAGLVHLNGRHVVTIGPGGLVLLPITAVQRAWKV
jgi:hypothetical protein